MEDLFRNDPGVHLWREKWFEKVH